MAIKPDDNAKKPIFVDQPDVREIFADQVRLMMFNDHVLRLELCVNRVDGDLQPGVEPKSRQYPVVRLALTQTAMMQMHQHITSMMASLEKQGLLKMGQVAAPPQAKH